MLYEKIEQVKIACNKAELRVPDEAILENATRIYNTEFIQNSKGFIKKESPKNAEIKDDGTPATEKQIGALKKMRIKHNPGITKQEAFKLISERIEGNVKEY